MTKREASPHINTEAEYYLSLKPEQRRRLPFAAPCISQDTIYRVAQKEKQAQAKPAPKQP